jgi:hypothetical protein
MPPRQDRSSAPRHPSRWPPGSTWLNCFEAALKGTKIMVDQKADDNRQAGTATSDAEAILATTPGVNGLYGVTPATVPRRLRPWSQRPGQLRCTSSPTTLPPRHLQVVLVGVPPVAAEGTEMLVRPGSGWLCVLGAVQAQAHGERARPWCVASSSSAGPVVGWSLCPCGRSAA